MQLNFVYDASVDNAPAGFKTALAAVAQFLDRGILDPVTVTIEVGYGEFEGSPLPAGVTGEGGFIGEPLSYAQLVTELKAHAASAAATTADAHLPAGDPSGGAGFIVANAILKAWGLPPAGGTVVDGQAIDGFVGFGSGINFDYSTTGAVGAGQVQFAASALHEVTHALGRVSALNPGNTAGQQLDPLDLFQYSAPGVLQTVPAQPSYFSIDGGQTHLGDFDTTGDASDWAQGHAPDAFNEFLMTGVNNGVSATDAQEMSVIGFAVACFAAGTRIRTPGGEVAVEELRPGADVALERGGTLPVVWTGHRRVDCRRHPRPESVWPVRVAKDALGYAMPRRPLWLSPDHAVFLEGVLIPIHCLVNRTTIAQEPCEAVTYWHVELARHDVLLAEGLPAESYLDTGNRGAFAEAAGPVMLHPDFARGVWEAKACARLILGGPALLRARQRVQVQAAMLAAGQAEFQPRETGYVLGRLGVRARR